VLNVTSTLLFSTLSLHDALPIFGNAVGWWNYARPNLVGDPSVSNPTSAKWFNPDAFSVPVLSYGSFGRNVLRTDGVTNIDFSLRSEEHTSELQSRSDLVCRLLLE